TLKNDKTKLEKNLKEKESEISTLKNDKTKLEKNLKEKESEISTLKNDKTKLEEDLKEKESEISTLKNDKTKLEKNLKEKESEISTLKNDKTKLEEDLKEKEIEMKNLDKIIIKIKYKLKNSQFFSAQNILEKFLKQYEEIEANNVKKQLNSVENLKIDISKINKINVSDWNKDNKNLIVFLKNKILNELKNLSNSLTENDFEIFLKDNKKDVGLKIIINGINNAIGQTPIIQIDLSE
ncbi:hypothetical protein TS70_06560, partial [Spiroplasma sp. hyd1]